MLNITENTLKNISSYEEDIARLSFYNQNKLPFVMDHLASRATESSHIELILDLDKDINKTADYLFKFQEALLISNHKFQSDDINLLEYFEEDNGFFNILGININKHSSLKKSDFKSKIIEKVFNMEYSEYKDILKFSRTKKTDDITLSPNPSDNQKMIYLALKAKEDFLQDFAREINKRFSIYRNLRNSMENNELKNLDYKVHGFKRTMIDGITQKSTYLTSENILQLASSHQKDITHQTKIKKMQSIMKRSGIAGIEIDYEDDLNKIINLISQFQDLTFNTKSRVVVKTRKLGNYAGAGFNLFGMYLPHKDIIAMDSRDPSALVHEGAHWIDYKNNFVSSDIRHSFVNSMRNVLQKQYHKSNNVIELISGYSKLLENPTETKKIIDLLYSGNEHYLERANDLFNEKPELFLVSLVNKLCNDNPQEKLLSKINPQDVESKRNIREAFKLFNQIKDTGISPHDVYENIFFANRNGRNYYKNKSFEHLEEHINNHFEIYGSEYGSNNLPQLWGYFSRSTEIIARAGEIGYLLSKYNYQGHENQEELDEFIAKVSKTQEKEKNEIKYVSGCHNIQEYTGRSEYFGLSDASPETLNLIKSYYKPFFQPKSIYELENNELVKKSNSTNLDPVDDGYLRKLMVNMLNVEFEKFEEIKQQTKSIRKKQNKKSFDKNKHPLSYLDSFEKVKIFLKLNEEEELLNPKLLFNYLVKNISDLGRTTLNNDFNISKQEEKIKIMAKIIASQSEFGEQTQKSIEAFKKGDLMKSKNRILSSFSRYFEEAYDVSTQAIAPKILGVSYKSNNLSLKIFEYIKELGEENKDNPDNIDNVFIPLSNSQEWLSYSTKKKNEYIEDHQNTLIDLNGISENDPDSLLKLDNLKNKHISYLNQSNSKEEVLLNYLMALDAVSDVLNDNIKYKPELIQVDLNKYSDESNFIHKLNELVLNFSDEVFEKYHRSLEYSLMRSKNNDKIKIYFKNEKESMDFSIFNQETKREILNNIIKYDNNPEKNLIKVKSKRPKNKLIKLYENNEITDSDINDFFSNKKIHDVSNNFISEYLMKKESYSLKGKLSLIIADDILLRLDASRNLEEGIDIRFEKAINFLCTYRDYAEENNFQPVINKDKAKEFIEIYAREQESQKMGASHVYDNIDNENLNKQVFKNFIKPINNTLSNFQNEIPFVLKHLNESITEPESKMSQPIYKKPILSYLSILENNNIINNAIDHVKDFKTMVKYLEKEKIKHLSNN